MKRVVLLFALAGCAFAQKHPAITVGLIGGTIGFGTCELGVGKPGTCGLVGGGAALFLGGITGLVTLLTNAGDHTLPQDDDDQGPEIKVRTHTPPPPGLPPGPPPDAGVPAPPVADAAVAD